MEDNDHSQDGSEAEGYTDDGGDHDACSSAGAARNAGQRTSDGDVGYGKPPKHSRFTISDVEVLGFTL